MLDLSLYLVVKKFGGTYHFGPTCRRYAEADPRLKNRQLCRGAAISVKKRDGLTWITFPWSHRLNWRPCAHHALIQSFTKRRSDKITSVVTFILTMNMKGKICRLCLFLLTSHGNEFRMKTECFSFAPCYQTEISTTQRKKYAQAI